MQVLCQMKLAILGHFHILAHFSLKNGLKFYNTSTLARWATTVVLSTVLNVTR